MKMIGSLILLVSLGLLILVAVGGVQDLSTQALNSNSTVIVDQTTHADNAINPVFYALGFVVLIVGAAIAIDAYC